MSCDGRPLTGDRVIETPLPVTWRKLFALAEPAGDDPGRQIREPSAAQPAERAVCTRGDRALSLDHGRPCRRLCGTLRPLYEMIKAHGFAAERIHGDDTAGKAQDPYRTDLDLCP